MSKYSSEFKLEVVNYYLSNYISYDDVAEHFEMPNASPIKRRVNKYKQHGGKGLFKNPKSSYDGNFKQNVVEYMHSNHLSCNETATHFNLSSDVIVGKWKRIYYEEGPQALYEERRGRSKNMSSKPRKKKLSKDIEEDLIAENQRLRMENAYLKNCKP